MTVTTEETQSAVATLLYQNIQVPTLASGNRDTLTLKDRVYSAIILSLLMRPESLCGLAWLTKNRLSAEIGRQLSRLDEALRLAPRSDAASGVVTNTNQLTQAQTSIKKLMLASSEGVAQQVAVDQAVRHLDQFTQEELAPGIVSRGELQETGEGARKRLLSLVYEIQEAHHYLTEVRGALLEYGDSVKRARTPVVTTLSLLGQILNSLTNLQGELTINPGSQREAVVAVAAVKASLAGLRPLALPGAVKVSATGSWVDSDGFPPAIDATISGPYAYMEGTDLNLEVNGAPVTFPLPGNSQPFIVGVPNGFPSPVFTSIGFMLDHTTLFAPVINTSFSSGSDAASGLSSILSPEIEVTWNSGAGTLTFTRLAAGDDAHIRVLAAPGLDFRDWAFGDPGSTEASRQVGAAGTPISARDVATALSKIHFDVGATALPEEEIATLDAEAISTRFWSIVARGSDLDSDGTVWVEAGANSFIDVKAGMFLVIGDQGGSDFGVGAPGLAAGTYSIEEAQHNRLRLGTAPPAATASRYHIGSVLADTDARLSVVTTDGSTANAGYYRVTSSAPAQITPTPPPRENGAVRITAFRQLLSLRSKSTTTTTTLEIPSPSAGSALLGMTVSEPPSLTRINVPGTNLLREGVLVGDAVQLTSPTAALYRRLIKEVDAHRLVVDTPVPYEVGSWGIDVISVSGEAFSTFQASLPDPFDLRQVLLSLQHLAAGNRYRVVDRTRLEAYRTWLNVVRGVCSQFSLPRRDTTAEQIVATLREHNFDRALDILLAGHVDQFTSLTADEVSYTSHAIRTTANTVREVLPSSRTAQGPDVYQVLSSRRG